MSESGSGLLAEHEAPSREEPKSVYEPSEEERRAIALVKRLLEKAKKHRAKYDDNWLHYYRMFRGRQWTEQRPAYRHSEVINLVFKLIQSQVPLQTDSRPRISFVPQEPGDRELSEILNQLCESDWERHAWLHELTAVIYDANIYGIGCSEEAYSATVDMGLGSATYESVDPLELYPDPDAFEINDQTGKMRSEFFIRAMPIDVDKLKAKYPDKADFLKPDLQNLGNDDRAEVREIKVRSALDARVVTENQGGQQHYLTDNKALYIEAWVKDSEIVENMVKLSDDNGGEKVEYEQRLKYPNGRKICMSSDVLLHDGPNPYADGEFPYSKYVNYLLPREYYGISEVENLESPQKIFNKLVSFALDVLTLMGNPVWILPTSSGIDAETVTNRPGLIMEPADAQHGIQRVEGVQLQPYVMQLIQNMKEWFDDEGGSNDITRGITPGGVTAASAITQLQDAAQTRIRQKMRNVDTYLKSVGRHWLNRVLQFYDAQRVHRVTGNDGVQKYFKFSVAQNEMGQKVARYTPYRNMGGVMEPGEMQERIIQGQFDVEVQTGSTLPFAKAEKEQRLFALFDRGLIPGLEVLKGLDYPNAEAVYQQVQEQQQAAQQQAAAGGK